MHFGCHGDSGSGAACCNIPLCLIKPQIAFQYPTQFFLFVFSSLWAAVGWKRNSRTAVGAIKGKGQRVLWLFFLHCNRRLLHWWDTPPSSDIYLIFPGFLVCINFPGICGSSLAISPRKLFSSGVSLSCRSVVRGISKRDGI